MGISVVGVTKCVTGDIKIAKIFKNCGIKILGDSRLKNLKKLRSYFGSSQILMLLRTPMLSEVSEAIEVCDISINTQIETVKKISKICSIKKRKHNIIVMVETDDEREGLLPDEAEFFCKKVMESCENVKIVGLGTNARCISDKKPTIDSLKVVVDLKKKIKNITGLDIPVISGGNSSIWNLIEKKAIPKEINQVRIGEAILLGHETINYKSIDKTFGDAFILKAEVIEVKRKNRDVYKAILALGIQDVNKKNIFCRNLNLHILNQSSDHTVIEIYNKKNNFLSLNVGTKISFNLDYFGLLSCMSSPFVEKKYIKK